MGYAAVLVAGLCAAAAPFAAAQRQAADRPPVDELVRALQARYQQVRDFSASFVQSYAGGVLRTTATERGTVLVKKPGKMRWTYTAPEEKLFVSNGTKMYSYLPADRQVIVADLPPEDEASTPALFLAGKGDFVRDFEAAYTEVDGAPPGTHAIRLTPRRPQADYGWLTLVVDAATLRITRLVAADLQGGVSSFTFSNLKENVGLADRQFEFQPPRGVDVITSHDR